MESVWVKIASQCVSPFPPHPPVPGPGPSPGPRPRWIAFLLYCWTVVAPLLCPNREFG